ncbi:hypothetical protein O6H91_21G064100 [Diphasiastrum complanatum]|uniref:Uncharacterized protein n=1 Tax=Diphasiastrum complanatum TaxID=34168 RepID=A0ACC2AL70_DIPCM|nr:hypothetical protein O6H91_21G064100 [Diphasiastrum complanatum]
MKISNQLTGIIIFITLILSLPIIGVGIWLATKHNTDCVRFLQWPMIIIGVFILVVSLAGFVGSCFRVAWLLWLYLLVMFLLIVLLLAFTVFAFVVTNQGAGQKGYKEYRLGDYSTSLQRRVENSNNRDKIHSCLSDAKFCSNLNKYNTISSFDAADLSPVQVWLLDSSSNSDQERQSFASMAAGAESISIISSTVDSVRHCN